MSDFRQRLAWILMAALLLLPAHTLAQGQDWRGPARDLAEKIVAHLASRSAVAFSFRNSSSLDAADAADIRRALESQLRAAGVRVVPREQAVDEVRVTISERIGEYLWVAEVGREDPRDVVIVASPLPRRAAGSANQMVIRILPLVSEDAQILDAAPASIAGGPPSLLVLDADGVKLYQNDRAGWKLQSNAAVAHERPWPRDLRGRMVAQEAAFTAFLPGTRCTGQWSPQFTLSCGASDDPWPLATAGAPPLRAFFNASRNFFAGPISPPLAADVRTFFTVAHAGPDANAWAIAATDGTTRIVASSGQTTATFADWGSDLASVNSACDAGPVLLATRAGALDQPDTVRGYRLLGRRVVEVAEALPMAGPVTAMWTMSDGNSALVVSRNLKTGEYEASSVAVTCGR